MPRPLPVDRPDCSWKAVCPYCPYNAGSSNGNPNSHNLRKHIHAKHPEQNLTYVDTAGFKMLPVTSMIAIKYNDTTKKYGQGFCFKCCSHIYCRMPTTATKLSTIGSHVCPQKQVREYKTVGTNPKPPRERRTMTDTDSLKTLFEKYGIDVVEDEDEKINLHDTLRHIKAKQDEKSFIEQLRGSKKYQQVIVPMLHKAMKDHEEMYADWDAEDDDPDDPERGIPLFDANVVLWQLMPTLLSAETKETHKDKIIAGLRLEKDQLEDQVDQCKIAQERMKREYEERLERLSIDYSEYRAKCEKGDGGDVVTHAQ